MKLLHKGSKGANVVAWQHFLIGRGAGLDGVAADGDFGKKTVAATRAFQTKNKLHADGKVGNRTLAKAMALGFGVVEESPGADWPPAPKGLAPLSKSKRKQLFGSFAFKAAPTARNREAIKIVDGWARKNIVRVELPGIDRRCRFHKLVAPQLEGLFVAWGRAGLIDLVVSFNGAYVPRYVRGSRKNLSNHSWGTAFDINARVGNRLGMIPALKGEPGSVRELVPLANKFGFFWGGHYSRRKDGMHFECIKVLQ